MEHHPTHSRGAPSLPAGRSARAWLIFCLAVLLLLTADLLLKQWSFAHVAGHPVTLTRQKSTDPIFWMQHRHDPMTLIPHGLALHLTANPGAIFGLGKGNQVLFILMSLIATAVIAMLFYRSVRNARWTHLGLALILAGALGNLHDRLFYNAVRDMLYLFPGVNLPFGWTWPGGNRELYPWIFNLADLWLLTGVGLMLLISWRDAPKPPAPAPESEPH